VIVQDFTLTPPLDPGVAGTPEPGARMPEGVGRCGLIGTHLRNSAFLEADQHGTHMSVRELLDTLAGIQETVPLPRRTRAPRARRMLTDIDPTQQRLYDLFGLDTYAPRAELGNTRSQPELHS